MAAWRVFAGWMIGHLLFLGFLVMHHIGRQMMHRIGPRSMHRLSQIVSFALVVCCSISRSVSDASLLWYPRG